MVEIRFPDVMAGPPPATGVVLGSTSLLGGDDTIIAWTPDLHARGLGMAMATLGLVALTAARPLPSGLHTALRPGEPSFSANRPKTNKETLRSPARSLWPQLRPAAARRAATAADTART